MTETEITESKVFFNHSLNLQYFLVGVSPSGGAPVASSAAQDDVVGGGRGEAVQSTFERLRNNPILGDMFAGFAPLGDVSSDSTSFIKEGSIVSLDEIQRFLQKGAPTVSEKAECVRVMDKKKALRTVRKFQVMVSEKMGAMDNEGRFSVTLISCVRRYNMTMCNYTIQIIFIQT